MALYKVNFSFFPKSLAYHKVNKCKCCMLHFIYCILPLILLLRCTFPKGKEKSLNGVLFRLLHTFDGRKCVYLSTLRLLFSSNFNSNSGKFTAYNAINSWMQSYRLFKAIPLFYVHLSIPEFSLHFMLNKRSLNLIEKIEKSRSSCCVALEKIPSN